MRKVDGTVKQSEWYWASEIILLEIVVDLTDWLDADVCRYCLEGQRTCGIGPELMPSGECLLR